MDKNDIVKFRKLHEVYDNLFYCHYDVYNDNSSVIRANTNRGTVMSRPRKGKLLFYNQPNLRLFRNKLIILKNWVFLQNRRILELMLNMFHQAF